MARKVSVEIVGDSASVERSFKRASHSANGFSRSLSTAERDATKSFRGIAAGSGVFRSLGRSLAFASAGFLGFASAASALRSAIDGAEELQKANDSLGVVIRRNNGDVARALPLLDDWAKAQERLGVSESEALTGLKQTSVLTGSIQKGMLAYTMGLELARAENLSITAAMRITAKAIQGQTTSLTRYGIVLPKTTNAQKIFNAFQARFAHQAETNTSAFDRLRASYNNITTTVGTALLPVFEKYAESLSNWLSKTRNQEAVTRKVNAVLQDAATIFRGVAAAVKAVDRVTGSFTNTLELLLALKFASVAYGWLGGIEAFTGSRGGGGLIGAELASAKLLARLRALAAIGVITIEVDLFEHFIQKYGLKNTIKAGTLPGQTLGPGIASDQTITVNGKTYPIGSGAAYEALVKAGAKLPPIGKVTAREEIQAAKRLGGTASIPAPPAQHRRKGAGNAFGSGSGAAAGSGSSSSTAAKSFTLPFRLQLAQAKAGATSTTSDDLAVARQIKAFILKAIPHLHGQRLVQAYQQLGQVNSEIAADVQKASAAAVKAKKKADSFTEPLALQLAEARAQALGLPDKSILLKMKRAALRAIHSGKLSIQGQIDAWNQVASLNDQLKTATTTAAVKFKQASTKALTAGLGLSEAQRKALRARLSQLGPGGTVPNQGVGAYGYQINPNTDRPIVIHTHVKVKEKEIGRASTRYQQRHRRRNPSQRRGPNAAISSA